jgi:hypothetical protein
LLKAGTDPQVVAYLIPNSRYVNFIEFVVANVGRGPAYDVSYSIVTGKDALEAKEARLREPATPFAILPQDEKIRGFLGSASDLLKDPPLAAFTVNVTYRNSWGRKTQQEFRLDITPYRSLTKIGKRPEEEISEALKKIEQTMGLWNMSRLKVETITTKERQQEQRELYEQMKKEEDSQNQ